MDISKIIPSFVDGTKTDAMQYYGLLGDYIGGFWGTLIGAFTLIAVFLTWRATRHTEYRSKTYQVFAEMLRTHEEIVSSMQVNGFKGRDALVLVLSEFYAIYRITKEISINGAQWDINSRIDIAYTYTFFGPHVVTTKALKHYNQEEIKKVNDAIIEAKRSNKYSKKTYSGHQNRLSHYFRNLYSAYVFIESSRLRKNEKLSLAKILRSKLSNYEQAITALNVISNLGQEWERSKILLKYKPIKNIPEMFFTFDEDFTLTNRFPYINFEWESSIKTTLKSHSFRLGGSRLVYIRETPRKT